MLNTSSYVDQCPKNEPDRGVVLALSRQAAHTHPSGPESPEPIMSNVNYRSSLNIQGKIQGVARVRLAAADLTEAAGTQTFTFGELITAHPIGSALIQPLARIVDAWIVRLEDFVDNPAVASAVTLSLGDAAAPIELLDTVDVFTGAKATSTIGIANGLFTFRTFEADYQPQVVLAADVNVDTLTGGIVEVCIEFEAFDDVDRWVKG